MGRWPRWLAWLLVAAALAVVGVVGLRHGSSPAVGRPAPALPRERLAGPPVTLGSLLAGAHGRPVVITFWASWCEPCAHEAPALQRFAASASGRGRIVGVDWSDSVAQARSFVHRYALTFPNLRDADGTVGNDYQINGLPTSFIVAASGRIRAQLRGPQDERSLARALSGR